MEFSLFHKQQKRPDNMLPPGWQFYSRPSNLELPGTVFRIDGQSRRYIVDRLAVAVDTGPEPGTSKVQLIEIHLNFLARLIALDGWDAEAGAGKMERLEFEISDPVRQSTTDRNMDAVLKPFLSTMEWREKNRYYVIREARSATAMTYRLTSQQLGELGGKAAVSAAVEAGAKVAAKEEGVYELTQRFPERLAVMFLPEEIAPVRAGLGAGEAELGRVAVTDILEWQEPAPKVRGARK